MFRCKGPKSNPEVLNQGPWFEVQTLNFFETFKLSDLNARHLWGLEEQGSVFIFTFLFNKRNSFKLSMSNFLSPASLPQKILRFGCGQTFFRKTSRLSRVYVLKTLSWSGCLQGLSFKSFRSEVHNFRKFRKRDYAVSAIFWRDVLLSLSLSLQESNSLADLFRKEEHSTENGTLAMSYKHHTSF